MSVAVTHGTMLSRLHNPRNFPTALEVDFVVVEATFWARLSVVDAAFPTTPTAAFEAVLATPVAPLATPTTPLTLAPFNFDTDSLPFKCKQYILFIQLYIPNQELESNRIHTYWVFHHNYKYRFVYRFINFFNLFDIIRIYSESMLWYNSER